MTDRNALSSGESIRSIDRVLRFWGGLAIGAVVVAPALFAGINLLPTYVRNIRAGVGLKMALEDPRDPVIGALIGQEMRRMAVFGNIPIVNAAKFDAVAMHIGPSSEGSILDHVFWNLFLDKFSFPEDAKIAMYVDAIQAPLMNCLESLLDSPHGGGSSAVPSPEVVERIHGLARYFEIASDSPVFSDPMKQTDAYVKKNLKECLKTRSGLENYMEKYFKNEVKYTVNTPSMINFVKDISIISANLEASGQRNGMYCVPEVPDLARGALEHIRELKITVNSLGDAQSKIISSQGSRKEEIANSDKLNEANRKMDRVELNLMGILTTKSRSAQTSGGGIMFSFVVWIVLVGIVYTKFAKAIKHLRVGPPAGRGSPPPPMN